MKKIFICLLVLAPRLLLAQAPEGLEDERLVAANREVSRAQAAADRPGLIQALEDLGRVQLELDSTSEALASFRLSLKLARESDEQPAIATNLLSIGRIHLQEGRVPAAVVTLKRAVAAAEQIDAQDVLLEAHASLSQAAAATGQYRQAYESSVLATELVRIRTEQVDKEQQAELEEQREADRKALESEAVARQQELLQERQEKAGLESRLRLFGVLAIAGAVALLLLLVNLAGRQRFKRKTTQTLAEKDAALAEIEDELKRSSEERERLSQLRAHALSEYDRLSAELLKSAGERDRMAADLEKSSAKLQRTSEQLEHHFIELKRASADRDRAVGELAQFAGERDQHLVAIDQTVAKVERLSGDLERTVEERDQHASMLEHTTAEAERISDALMQASADRDTAAAERDKAVGERDRLTDQLARVTDELEQLRNDCRQDISAMADRNAAVRSRLTEMESFNSTLSQHLKVLLVAVRSSLGALQQDAAAGDVEQLEKDVRRTHIAVGNTVRLLDELQKLLLVGRVVHAPEAVSMSELAYEAIGQVQGLADRRVEVVIAPTMPAVYGDRTQLLEVLRRLLENGGKFMGTQPSPRLQVGHRRDWPKADSPEEVFYVRDNGIGVEAHDIERIFTLFEKVDPASEGLGIGLPLVKRIIEAHGGRAWVESDGAGRGSTFCFTLAKKYASPPS